MQGPVFSQKEHFPSTPFTSLCMSKEKNLPLNTFLLGASQVVLEVKYPPANTGDIKDTSSIPGWEDPWGRHGNPLQHSCLGNPRHRGAWLPTAHGVTESDMTEVLSMHACFYLFFHFLKFLNNQVCFVLFFFKS